MKRRLLSLIGATAMIATAGAITPFSSPNHSRITKGDMQSVQYPIDLTTARPAAKVIKAADASTFDYAPAYEPYTALGFNSQVKTNKLAMAFEMTPETTTEFAGTTIALINFYTGVNSSTGINNIKEVTVFISDDASHTGTVMEQKAPTTDQKFTYYTVKLDQPYTIKAGTDIFVGCYSILTHSKDLCIVVDAMNHESSEGGWASKSSKTGKFSWDNIADSYGFVCVSATLTGIDFPQNKIKIGKTQAPVIVSPGKEFTASISLTNLGQNPIESLELNYTINGGNPVDATFTFEQPLTSMKSDNIDLNLTLNETNSHNFEVKITKLNGVDISDKDLHTSFAVSCMTADQGYVPNAVIEEFTGTWCGYCPRGIVTMEYIRDHYRDGTLIPVAVHSGDAMESDSYVAVDYSFNGSGYPNSIINRNTAYSSNDGSLYPYPASTIVSQMQLARQTRVPVEASLTCSFTDDTKKAVAFEGFTRFFFDVTNPDFAISFGITEDKVGPYAQNNGYAGQKGTCEGWDDQGSSVRTIFNDVARKLDTIDGIEGLIPATVSAGAENPYTYTMTLPSNVKADNINGIVYITHKPTGVIINAATVKAGNFGTAGVDDILSEDAANAPVEYFNLQGIRVDNPSGGIFIRRQGNKTEKVAIN